MVTRPAVERLRPGIIDCESSSVNFNGQLPTLPRSTATGMPGASTDFATMKSVSPAVAFALSAGARLPSPLTAVPEPPATAPDAATGLGAAPAAPAEAMGEADALP